MKKIILAAIIPFGISLASSQAFAANCEAVIEGNDMMQFNKKQIEVDSSCKKFKVTMKHVGQLPKAAMGHNWLLSKKADAAGIAGAAMAAGLAKDYVPQDSKVIAATKLIGGGEETSVTIDVSKLTKGGDYLFYCTFPGHFTIMQGSLIVK